jgi:ADP-ribosylglycohydrolase
MLHFAYKYGGDFESCLLANTNNGGENVARGQTLGALIGAAYGSSRIPDHLKEGLVDSANIAQEIATFVATIPQPTASSTL